ncbi:MAG: HEPN domain-containing protein [Nanoarchaeota archaeon]
MKKINFLIKLQKEGKLKMVEPSGEMKKSYLNKSESNLISSKILFENNLFEEAISMAYYSMYNALNALLFQVGIKCENHSGAIFLLKELFGLDNSGISFAKQERIDKQYYVDFNVTKEQVLELIKIAEEASKELLNFIAILKNKDIESYRTKLLELLK